MSWWQLYNPALDTTSIKQCHVFVHPLLCLKSSNQSGIINFHGIKQRLTLCYQCKSVNVLEISPLTSINQWWMWCLDILSCLAIEHCSIELQHWTQESLTTEEWLNRLVKSSFFRTHMIVELTFIIHWKNLLLTISEECFCFT